MDYNKIIDISEQDPLLLSKTEEINDEKIDEILISQEYIEKRVKALARKICDDYRNCKEITILVVLKGAFVFASDLAREIYCLRGPGIFFEFIKTSTYGRRIKSIGETERKVKIELEPNDIADKSILIVEDIIDQAFTLSEIRKYLINERHVDSIKICVLLDKQLSESSGLRRSFKCDYTGFIVPDRWIAGYGLDAGENFRQLPFIVTVNEKLSF